jgi:hypothetical protein
MVVHATGIKLKIGISIVVEAGLLSKRSKELAIVLAGVSD